MNLIVLLFAGLRQSAGTSSLKLEIRAGSTVEDFLAELANAHPELAGALPHCRVAVEQEFVGPDSRLEAQGETPLEIALIPPVSGGHDGSGRSPGTSGVGQRSALTPNKLSLDAVIDAVKHRDAGGIATFTGNIREQSRGKTVRYLEYEAYAPMALRVMDRIALKIEQEIEGVRVALHHRVGRLEIGESAVVIAASAHHRAEAFEACRAVIEGLKQDVPIWKREVDSEGAEWIGQGP